MSKLKTIENVVSVASALVSTAKATTKFIENILEETQKPVLDKKQKTNESNCQQQS